MADILAVFESLTGNGDFTVVERLDIPAREEKRTPIPAAFRSGAVGQWLQTDASLAGTLWQHQALALEAAVSGQNVVIATGTASGKSLVFQAAAIRLLEEDDEARVLVLYPLKALAADQVVSWKKALRAAGFNDQLLAKVTGEVSREERKLALENARILIATPDVCHAWLMRELASPVAKRFLASTSLVVLDEAHVLEAVFGSNFAFLFRRLHTAINFSRAKQKKKGTLQVIAASATIADPANHLRALTGLEFAIIDEKDDGSPHYARALIHLAIKKGDPLSIVPDLQRELLENSDDGSFITFVDSRQGVERIAILTNLPLVKPYRSGYEAEDRAKIEETLRSGDMRGVVATSALELGIDIPHFVVGINLGVPVSRKALRQRLGRIGRTRAGAFAIVAEPQAFARYGSTLKEYYAASVEPSHLYLGNRFMQFAHAKCLAEELEMLGVIGRPVPPAGIDWPEGFTDVFEFARVGGGKARPREFDHIAKIGGDAPHLNYPLRNIGEENFTVGWGMQQKIGTVTLQQAIREAYPGAIYLHMARRWRVREWRSTVWERTIKVYAYRAALFTRPLIRTFVNFSVDREGLVEGHYRKSDHGFLAECQLQITERVEGFEERGERKLYKDLRSENPAMTSKTRDFRTTGVVLKIEEDWIKHPGTKTQLADALRDLVVREYSISPQDLGATATNIALVTNGQRCAVSDALVIYDATYGSLRLTEPVFNDLKRLIKRLERSSEFTSDDEALIPSHVVKRLRGWYEGLGTLDATGVDVGLQATLSDGLIWVYAPGSIVALPNPQGVLRDIEIIGPEFVAIEGPPKLFYRYKAANGTKAMAPADHIQAVGDEFRQVKWNPKTGEYVEDDEDGDGGLVTVEPAGLQIAEEIIT